MTGSEYFVAQPPRENPPRVSSSGLAGASMTPSRDTLMNTRMSVMTSPFVHSPLHPRSVRWSHGRLVVTEFMTLDGVMEAPGFEEHRDGKNAWALSTATEDQQ